MSICKKIRAVMFDLDGTLLDTAPDFVVVVNQLLTELERAHLPEETIRAAVSNGSRALVTLALDMDDSHSDFEKHRLRLLELYTQHIAVYTRPFPGISELLNKLHERGIAWGIATNKPHLYTHLLLDALQIQPPPASVICPEDVKERKPHPESMYLAGQHIGCAPDEIIYVGDHQRDIECGKAAGSITIAAAYGYIGAEEDISLWQADYRVEHASEIWPIIDSLLCNTGNKSSSLEKA